MPRPRTPIGTFGEITFHAVAAGVTARCWFRDHDGRLRSIEATARTAKAAERELKARLVNRVERMPGTAAITADSPFPKLVELWLEDIDLEDKLAAHTRALYERNMRTLVLPTFQHLTLREVYKHWPSRGALALDGYVDAVGEQIAFRDTGDIRADLTAVVGAFVKLMRRKPSGPAFAQLIGAAQSDAELASAFEEHYFGPRRREAIALLEAARNRGQIPDGVELTTVADMLRGACYKRLLLPHLTGTLAEDFALEVVALTLAGVTAPSTRSPARTIPTVAWSSRASASAHRGTNRSGPTSPDSAPSACKP